MNSFGHIDLRVRDLEQVYSFYATLLPQLGFTKEWRGEGAFSFQTEGALPEMSWFGVIEDSKHVANATRIAFAVKSCAEVDRLAEVVRAVGGGNVDGPIDMEYSRIYRAVYFEDPSGNRLEVYYAEEGV